MTSAGRLNRMGRLRSEPEFWLGSNGNDFIRHSMVASATPAMLRKVTRQHSASPTTRTRAMTSTMAEVARIAREYACARLVLDTGLANSLAQRFYFRQGMLTSAIRFGQDL